MSLSIKPGTRVRLKSDDAKDGNYEVGIVIHVWEDSYDWIDAYVAFFGREFPTGKPKEKPYILRYSTSSLEVLP